MTMTEENRKKISDNLTKLFNIMNADTKNVFVRRLQSICGGNDSIGDKIKRATDIQLAQLTKVAGKCKFTEDPKPVFSEIVAAFKASIA